MAEEKKVQVTKEMKIAEVLKLKAQAAGVLFAHGMPCLGCTIALNESVEDAAMAHGIDLDELIAELNEA
jgi:hybrid cluster-associated redox disulfide protein